MATVDNSTQLVTSTESGTGWSVDVTNANLDPLLTLKDFIVKFDGVVQNNADFTKTSVTIITYNGGAIGSTTVTIQRDTPNERVKCLTFGNRIQSPEYEAEFNRVHKLINDSEISIGESNDVKVTVDDTTPGTLENKIVEGADVVLAVLNPGANEQLQISVSNPTSEPYVDINSALVVPNAVGTDAIAIGGNNTADGTSSIVLGTNSFTDNTDFATDNCIVIGNGATIDPTPTTGLNSSNSIAIGLTASITDGQDSVALGASSSCEDNNCVSLGCSASSSGLNAIAIGNTANAFAPNTISIGTGAETGGGTNSIAIGNAADSNGSNSIAIGTGSLSNANNAIQLGPGGNGGASTLQFLDEKIANVFGLQAKTVAGVPTDAAVDGTIQVDTTNDDLYFRSSSVWQLAGGGGGSALVNQDITSGVDITVTPGVSNDRLFITPTANINLILLTAGAANTTHFTFVNLDPSTFNIDVKIDLVGNPTILTLGGGITNINVGYTGTDYRFYG